MYTEVLHYSKEPLPTLYTETPDGGLLYQFKLPVAMTITGFGIYLKNEQTP